MPDTKMHFPVAAAIAPPPQQYTHNGLDSGNSCVLLQILSPKIETRTKLRNAHDSCVITTAALEVTLLPVS